MSWLEMELSLGVRRLLAVMLSIWNGMMAFVGFGLLISGLIMRGYITPLVEPLWKGSSTALVSSSVVWYPSSLIALGLLMIVTYTLGSQVSSYNCLKLLSTVVCRCGSG